MAEISLRQLQDLYIAITKVIGDSKLNSALQQLAGMPDSDFKTAIQKGSGEAVQVDMNTLRGFGGDYNPTTNTPALSDGTAAEKTYYRVSEDGIRDFGSGAIDLKADNFIEYKAGQWRKVLDETDLQNVQINIDSNYAY